ncbi:MAG: hypothetical protein ACM3JD_02585 [Rudaea sp.]
MGFLCAYATALKPQLGLIFVSQIVSGLLAVICVIWLAVGLANPQAVLPQSVDPRRWHVIVIFIIVVSILNSLGAFPSKIAIGPEVTSTQTETTETSAATLEASVVCSLDSVIVSNASGEDWTEIKILVNEGYSHAVDGMTAGEAYELPQELFTNLKGERLNLSRVACKTINIHATTPGGRKHCSRSY